MQAVDPPFAVDDDSLERVNGITRIKTNGVTRPRVASRLGSFLKHARISVAASAFPANESTIAVAAAGTRWLPPQECLINDAGGLPTTEAAAQVTACRAHTITAWAIRVTANAAAAQAVFTLRVAGADTALAVNIPAGQVGIFVATGAVDVAANQAVAGRLVNGAGGALTVAGWSVEGYTA